MRVFIHPLVDDSRLQPRHIAEDVRPANRCGQLAQEAVVTHPVGHELTHPGNALRTDIVAAGHPDLARHLRFGMTARGAVLRAGLRIHVRVRRMTLPIQVRATMRLVAVTAARVPADHVCDVERTFQHRLYPRVDDDVVPNARRASAQLLGVDRMCDVLELVRCVAMRLARLVLEAVLRLRARRACRVSARAADELTVLVGVQNFTGLDDECLGLAAALLDRIDQRRLGGERIAMPNRSVPLPVGPAVQPLDTAQLRRDDGGVDRVQEAAGGERALPLRRRTVCGIDEQRIVVADAVTEMADAVRRGFGVPLLVGPAHRDADQLARFVERAFPEGRRLCRIGFDRLCRRVSSRFRHSAVGSVLR